MLGQETHIQLRQAANKSSGGHSASAHLAQSSGSSDREPFRGTCFNCNQRGHRSSDCKKEKKNRDGRSGQKDGARADRNKPPMCTWCGKGPHKEADCYSKRDGKPRVTNAEPVFLLAQAYQVGVESAESNAQSFILDSGASRHMASSAITLTNEVKCDTMRILVANGESLEAPTNGSMTLKSSREASVPVYFKN
jgi:hypothetical protein